ncbi:MAG TPA: hypothetical protein PKK10_05060 [Woeseiaceae bacterium]|nr:hypothetical protein [Woeseiaceae bacterium]
MPDPDFKELAHELLVSGFGPQRVQRLVSELEDHYDDLVQAALASGTDIAAAKASAQSSLGELRQVAVAMQEQPDLKCWAWHWPRVASILYPLAFIAVLPAVPLIVGARHAHEIMRWAGCMLLGATVTALMFLTLQLAITLG